MLKIENLTRTWGTFQLHNISFELRRGDYFVLLGPCGAGKTLMLETIAGFWKPQTGKIFLDDRDITHQAPEKREIGFVYQEYFLFPHLSVMENILYGLRMHKTLADSQIKLQRLVDVLGLKEIIGKRRVDELSGGERQRVALARAIIWEPKILLLDEPTHSLDHSLRQVVLHMLQELNRQCNLTLIHVTHDSVEARQVAKTIGILNNGRMVESGAKDKVFNNPKSNFAKSLCRDKAANKGNS